MIDISILDLGFALLTGSGWTLYFTERKRRAEGDAVRKNLSTALVQRATSHQRPPVKDFKALLQKLREKPGIAASEANQELREAEPVDGG